MYGGNRALGDRNNALAGSWLFFFVAKKQNTNLVHCIEHSALGFLRTVAMSTENRVLNLYNALA